MRRLGPRRGLDVAATPGVGGRLVDDIGRRYRGPLMARWSEGDVQGRERAGEWVVTSFFWGQGAGACHVLPTHLLSSSKTKRSVWHGSVQAAEWDGKDARV